MYLKSNITPLHQHLESPEPHSHPPSLRCRVTFFFQLSGMSKRWDHKCREKRENMVLERDKMQDEN